MLLTDVGEYQKHDDEHHDYVDEEGSSKTSCDQNIRTRILSMQSQAASASEAVRPEAAFPGRRLGGPEWTCSALI